MSRSSGGDGGGCTAQPAPAALASAAGCACATSTPRHGNDGAGCCAAASVAEVPPGSQSAPPPAVVNVAVLYATEGGAARARATELAVRLEVAGGFACSLHDCATFEPEALPTLPLALFVVSTHGAADAPFPPSAAFFFSWLRDAAADERVGSGWLAPTSFGVLGCCDSGYGARRANGAAKLLHATLRSLGGRALARVGAADDAAEDADAEVARWCDALVLNLRDPASAPPYGSAASDAASGGESESEGESELEDGEVRSGSEELEEGEISAAAGSDDGLDMEDIGTSGRAAGAKTGGRGGRARRGGPRPGAGASAAAAAAAVAAAAAAAAEPPAPREMVTTSTRASLVKQGYAVIGTHSGVKLCRCVRCPLSGRRSSPRLLLTHAHACALVGRALTAGGPRACCAAAGACSRPKRGSAGS